MTSETDALTELYTTLIDSHDGYETAAKTVESPRLTGLFTDLSSRRAQDAQELRQFLAKAGVALDDDGSLLATAHRQFLGLKDGLSGDDDAIIAEVIRGEEHLLAAYDKAIQPMTVNSPAFNYAISRHAALEDRLSNLRGEHEKAA